MKKYLILICASIFLFACSKKMNTSKNSSQGETFVKNVDQNAGNLIDDSNKIKFFENPRKVLKPAFQLLPNGSTKPKGWMLEIMKNDLEKGIVGNLDNLIPYIMKDDLYDKARRGGKEDIPLTGDQVLTGADWEISMLWWNGETIGNWWDGFVRHAFLTKNEKAMQESHAIVQKLLDSQDKDGYIGIYKENMRYQHEGSNGELWTQTTAFRMLLGYYELTQKAEVLKAVESAMEVTIKNYNAKTRSPFKLKNAYGGVTHGLMMTDVCETLYRITGKQKYLDYAVYLYQEFSRYSINRSFNDMRYPFLAMKDTLFEGHAAHTYEHLRSVLNAYYGTSYPELKTAYDNALYKLDHCILPSGGGFGNEWLLGQNADAEHTSAEFCSILHLRNFYNSAIQKTGKIEFADQAEKITFNAIMGFRNEDGTAITYGKSDNCHILDGKEHAHGEDKEDPRFKYSPTHSDPAVCCVPNYTRNFPYYLDNMWMQNEEGLVAVLYAPSVLNTKIKGVEIQIEQKTNYPFSEQIEFVIKSSKEAEFTIAFRKPEWTKSLDLKIENAQISQENGFYKVRKTWKKQESIKLNFVQETKQVEFNNESYFQRGALVFAYSIPHKEETTKTYEVANFKDYHCFPTDETYKRLQISENQENLEFVNQEKPLYSDVWHQEGTYLLAKFFNTKTNKTEDVKLVPMGNTILRKVTFEKQGK